MGMLSDLWADRPLARPWGVTSCRGVSAPFLTKPISETLELASPMISCKSQSKFHHEQAGCEIQKN